MNRVIYEYKSEKKLCQGDVGKKITGRKVKKKEKRDEGRKWDDGRGGEEREK